MSNLGNRLPFHDIAVESFRGVLGASLLDCQPINILVGDNNSGKTSLLEAILLLAAPRDASRWRLLTSLRGSWPLIEPPGPQSSWSRLNSLQWLFPLRDGKVSEICLSTSGEAPVAEVRAVSEFIVGEPEKRATVNESQYVEGVFRPRSELRTERGLEIRLQLSWNPEFPFSDSGQSLFPPPEDFRILLWETGKMLGDRPRLKPQIPTAFASPLSHRSDTYLSQQVSRLIRKERKEQALELLRQVDPRIADFNLLWPFSEDEPTADVQPRGSATVHLAVEGVGLVPVQGMGHGLRRALHLAGLVAELDKGGVLVVDEIEVGMHTSVLQSAFRWLSKACIDSGIQLFATTHSLEAVDALLASVEPEHLALFRLESKGVRRYSGELLNVARMEMGQEVR